MFHMALSAILVSLSYWENYSEVAYSNNRISLFIQEQIHQLRKFSHKIYLIVTPVKILLVFVFSYSLLPKEVQKEYSNFSKKMNISSMNVLHSEFAREDIFFYLHWLLGATCGSHYIVYSMLLHSSYCLQSTHARSWLFFAIGFVHTGHFSCFACFQFKGSIQEY